MQEKWLRAQLVTSLWRNSKEKRRKSMKEMVRNQLAALCLVRIPPSRSIQAWQVSLGITNPLTIGFAKKQGEQEFQITTAHENTFLMVWLQYLNYTYVFPTQARLAAHLKLPDIWISAECKKWAFSYYYSSMMLYYIILYSSSSGQAPPQGIKLI